MRDKIKVVYYIYGLNVGGAETFIYNFLKNINFDRYDIAFIVQSINNNNENLLTMCREKRIPIYVITSYYHNPIQSYFELDNIMKKIEPDIIHIHANSLANISPIKCAEKHRIKVVLHSHSSKNNGMFWVKCVHCVNRLLIEKKHIVRIACSKIAGEWMYGKNSFIIINNAINIKDYQFNMKLRKKIRHFYGIENKRVIGHVGRFVDAKNHPFILKVFAKYRERNKDAVLMLVGYGDGRDKILELIQKYDIEKSVILIENSSTVNELYSAFDCIFFPSKYEGLPFVLIEAQAAGLPVVASDQVTPEVNVSGAIQYLSLQDSLDAWVDALDDAYVNDTDRYKIGEKMQESAYNAAKMTKELEKMYEEILCAK